jgi:hypothetical protein
MLARGTVEGYDFNRMVVRFVMMNDKVGIPCAVSTDAMDRMEPGVKSAPSQREDQFMRLRDRIEAKATQKFWGKELEGNPPGIVLRSLDF